MTASGKLLPQRFGRRWSGRSSGVALDGLACRPDDRVGAVDRACTDQRETL
jgi:hypothetical protein